MPRVEYLRDVYGFYRCALHSALPLLVLPFSNALWALPAAVRSFIVVCCLPLVCSNYYWSAIGWLVFIFVVARILAYVTIKKVSHIKR